MGGFLPTTLAEAGGPLDVILVTGDAYVDHPAWGVAVIGRWLQAHGYKVGILAQPDWDRPDSWRVLGRPRLFFGVTAGNMDTMVNKYTAARRLRSTDAYSPGGAIGTRPDRATIAYVSRLRQVHKGVPVVLGGIEASLRRLVHYDYWQDKVRGSILLDAKADLLVFGMGERAVVRIAKALDEGGTVADCRDIPGVVYPLGAKESPPEGALTLPSLEACKADPMAVAEVARAMVREANPDNGRTMLQRHGQRWVVQNPPASPLDSEALDRLYELPWRHAAHPAYREPIPALTSIEGSVVVNRGCGGGCAFCSLTIHQGKVVTSRSKKSVLRELRSMAERPGFNGVVTDLGGPTANMFHMSCTSETAREACRRASCLHPSRCRHFGTDHGPYRRLLAEARKVDGVRHVYVNSGIRFDLALLDGAFIDDLAAHHVQGQLSVAPEHAAADSLKQMHKPPIEVYDRFVRRFAKANDAAGKRQFLVPYFLCAHPGTGPAEAVELALYMKANDIRPRQVQLFMPTPGTLATAAWHSGINPLTRKPVAVARGEKERSRQRALLMYWKREEWPHVREALRAWNRTDLIGQDPGALVPPGPAYGAWTERVRRAQGIRTTTHLGAKVDRAGRGEESEQTWERVGHGGKKNR